MMNSGLISTFASNRNLPKIAGKYNEKKLIICGSARGIWDDLESFGCKSLEGRGSIAKPGWDLMAINRMVEILPGNIEHAFSNHPEHLLAWCAARRPEYLKEFTAPKYTHSIGGKVDYIWPWYGHGTSALSACFSGLCMGYTEIVLAGIPLDDGPHNGEPSWRRCVFETKDIVSDNAKIATHWYAANKSIFGGMVKSLSGRTREWLGPPT